MEGGRELGYLKRSKPNLVLHRDFAFTEGFELGDEGVLDVTVSIVSEALEPDESGNEFKTATLEVLKAKPVNLRDNANA